MKAHYKDTETSVLYRGLGSLVFRYTYPEISGFRYYKNLVSEKLHGITTVAMVNNDSDAKRQPFSMD